LPETARIETWGLELFRQGDPVVDSDRYGWSGAGSDRRERTLVKSKIRLLIPTVALLTAVALPAQDASRPTRPPVDTSRSSLPAYQRTPTAKAGSSKKPNAKTTAAAPTPGRTQAPGSAGL